ncbi:retrovirus-related pol polyprotein from transposon TNT 1-94 [Tanacetum coccineum]
MFCYYDAFLTSVKPKTYKDALTQSCWIEAMQEELHEFEYLEVWELVPRPDKLIVITLKWIYKVKLDELGGILKNKTRLVDRGYRQEEGIDFEESFNPAARLEAVRIFLAFAAHMNMIVYQMDVKKTFLMVIFREKVYDSSKRTGDHTFVKRPEEGKGKDILLDYRFHELRRLFLNQSKYALESLKKYGMESCDLVDTPMVANPNWLRDQTWYMLCMYVCSILGRPTEKHLHAVKRIFRYLRGTVNRGLWYSKDSTIALTAFADVNHASCEDTRRSTSGSMQLLGDRLVSWSSKARIMTLPISVGSEYIALSNVVLPKSFEREPTFQVVLDALALALTPCYSAFLITVDVPKLSEFPRSLMVKNFDATYHDEDLVSFYRTWSYRNSDNPPILLLIRCINLGELLPLSSTEVYLERQLIDNRGHKKQDKMYYPRFTKGTDIAKSTRKRSKSDKHGHGNGKECAIAGSMLSRSKVNFGQQGQPKSTY